mmetsp:Transcript_54167/g.87676  ORF Transcript_54167/g.87676 Transcript_54167/m.87676 type:complete len:88 (-) Transcript_54167:2455-2718(-)
MYIYIQCWSALLHRCALELPSDTAGQSMFIMQLLQESECIAHINCSSENFPRIFASFSPSDQSNNSQMTCTGKQCASSHFVEKAKIE